MVGTRAPKNLGLGRPTSFFFGLMEVDLQAYPQPDNVKLEINKMARRILMVSKSKRCMVSNRGQIPKTGARAITAKGNKIGDDRPLNYKSMARQLAGLFARDNMAGLQYAGSCGSKGR